VSEIPGYWRNETSGILRPAVEAYLRGEVLTVQHISAMRAYCRQWITSRYFIGPGVEELRRRVDGLTTRQAIEDWMDLADEAGCDPL
jgi:hypothetical protein